MNRLFIGGPKCGQSFHCAGQLTKVEVLAYDTPDIEVLHYWMRTYALPKGISYQMITVMVLEGLDDDEAGRLVMQYNK